MNETIEFLKHYSPLISLFTFLAGLYFGNKRAIGRDRRKEFNDLAEPIIENFSEMQKWLERQTFTSAHLLPTSKIEKIKRRLSNRKLKKFERLLERYRASLQSIKESPEPAIHFGMSEAEESAARSLWVNHYPEAISIIAELNKFLRLR